MNSITMWQMAPTDTICGDLHDAVSELIIACLFIMMHTVMIFIGVVHLHMVHDDAFLSVNFNHAQPVSSGIFCNTGCWLNSLGNKLFLNPFQKRWKKNALLYKTYFFPQFLNMQGTLASDVEDMMHVMTLSVCKLRITSKLSLLYERDFLLILKGRYLSFRPKSCPECTTGIRSKETWSNISDSGVVAAQPETLPIEQGSLTD